VVKNTKLVVLFTILWLLFESGAVKVFAQTPESIKHRTQEDSARLSAVEREPENVKAINSLGTVYLHEGKWLESAHWFSKAYALSGGSESIGDNLAYAYMQAGELGKAKLQIEKMLARADSARLHNLLGGVEERQKNYMDAAREYHRAAEIDPSEPYIFDLATFLLQHKQYVGFTDESIKFFRYGVSQFPWSSQMMVGLGVALYASDQYDEAVQTLCAAVDLNPNDRRPIEFLGKVRKVSAALAEQVDRRLQDFAERYPGNAAANYYYAFSLWQRGGGEEGESLDKIEGLLRKAEAQAPEWYEPHYQLGLLYGTEKRYVEAIREMQKAIKIEPEFSPAHSRLAMFYNRAGDRLNASKEAAVAKQLMDRQKESEIVQEAQK
jgi:tetratricopeptide (TPR) repeat protein